MSIEASGFEELAADMRAAPGSLISEVGKVVSKGALNIKQQIQKDFNSSRHFGRMAPGSAPVSVRYDRKVLGNSAEAEIAPFLEQEGFRYLIGIAIHGGSRGGGGTVPDPLIALQTEAPGFEQALLNLAGTVLDE